MSDKTERIESPWHSEPRLEGERMSARTDRLGSIGAARGINRQCSIGWHEECSDPDGETCRCLCHGEQAKARIAAFDAHWSSEPQGKLPTADNAREFAKHDYLAGYDSAVQALRAERDEAVAQRDASRAVNAEFLAAAKPRTVTTAEQRDALPVGAIIMSASGRISCRFDIIRAVVFGDERAFRWADLTLPATVLFTPEVTE